MLVCTPCPQLVCDVAEVDGSLSILSNLALYRALCMVGSPQLFHEYLDELIDIFKLPF